VKELVQKYDIRVIGAGNDGNLSMKPEELTFGTVTVGFSQVLKLTVYNKSKTDLYIDFGLE